MLNPYTFVCLPSITDVTTAVANLPSSVTLTMKYYCISCSDYTRALHAQASTHIHPFA